MRLVRVTASSIRLSQMTTPWTVGVTISTLLTSFSHPFVFQRVLVTINHVVVEVNSGDWGRGDICAVLGDDVCV